MRAAAISVRGIGATLGSTLGAVLGGNNFVTKIAAQTVVGTFGRFLGCESACNIAPLMRGIGVQFWL